MIKKPLWAWPSPAGRPKVEMTFQLACIGRSVQAVSAAFALLLPAHVQPDAALSKRRKIISSVLTALFECGVLFLEFLEFPGGQKGGKQSRRSLSHASSVEIQAETNLMMRLHESNCYSILSECTPTNKTLDFCLSRVCSVRSLPGSQHHNAWLFDLALSGTQPR